MDDRSPHPAGAGRIDPGFGDWSGLRFDEDDERRAARRLHLHDRRVLGGWLAALLAVALIAGLYALRQPLSDWLWPDTRAQQLRAEAARALSQGRLTASDGRGARELYEAALALDPDRSDAREGLNRVGRAAIEQARRSIEQRRYLDAHAQLDLARELALPRAEVDALSRRLREREAAAAGLDQLLVEAAAARAQGRLDGDESAALPLYQRVLALQPERVDALEGREDTLSDLLQQARRALALGDLAKASGQVRRVREADPGHVDLPDTLTDLGRHLDQRRRQAERDLQRGRLPEALAQYRAIATAMPDDADAEHGIVSVATAYALRSERAAADFRFAEAESALREARAIAPDLAAVSEARQHLDRARATQKRLGQDVPPAERQRRLARLLGDIAEAERRGDLLSPPGDSAYDKLRAAQSLAPQDAKVRAAAARLLPAARRCFEAHLRANRLSRAGECLDARRALGGDDGPTREAKRRLAQRWIAVGDERLGAGEVQAAQAALATARRLDPGAAGLGELAQRVRSAAAATH